MKRFAVICSALLFVGSLAAAMLELAPAAIDLRGPVAAHLAASGVSHPVTAVLLNYRGTTPCSKSPCCSWPCWRYSPLSASPVQRTRHRPIRCCRPWRGWPPC